MNVWTQSVPAWWLLVAVLLPSFSRLVGDLLADGWLRTSRGHRRRSGGPSA